MFTYHFFNDSIEMYFKVGYWVVYCEEKIIEIYDKFYDLENPYSIGDKEYFRV